MVDYSDGTKAISIKEIEYFILKMKNKIPLQTLILAIIGDKTPLYGNLRLQKGIFIAINERIKGLDIEDPKFIPYKIGPYSFKIKEILDGLIEGGYVSYYGKKNSNSQGYFLTDKGKKELNKIIETYPELYQILCTLKKQLDEMKIEGIIKYIYNKPEYKKYIEKSQYKEKYKDIVWGRGYG